MMLRAFARAGAFVLLAVTLSAQEPIDRDTIESFCESSRVALQTRPGRSHLQRHVRAGRERARVLDRVADIRGRTKLLRRHGQRHLAEPEREWPSEERLDGCGRLCR